MLAFINMVKKYNISCNKCKNVKKSGNKIIRILVKSKSWNFVELKSKNLFKSKYPIKV